MAKRKIYAGSTSVTVPLFIFDSTSTTGGGLSGLTSSTSGLVCKYRRQGQSTWTTVTLSAATLGTWSSGGFIADTGGAAGTYELGLPNAATANGAQWVIVQLSGVANMVGVNIEVELDAVNYQDINLGLSRLDATISSRSTFAGGDTAGVTTLLSRLTSTRAGLLDNLDAAISTRLALAGYTAPDNSTVAILASRLSAARALLLDNLENLDMAISDLPTADEIGGELVGMTVVSVEI
jgi:hypothetical protein